MVNRQLSIVYPYYDNPNMLKLHVAEWKDRYPQAVKDAVEIVIVDDVSPSRPAKHVLYKGIAKSIGIPLRLFLIEKKVPWNWIAARNIGAYEAACDWLFLTDMDLMLRAEDAEKVLAFINSKEAKFDAFYTFDRVIAPDGRGYKAHPNTYLMSKALYWRIGGYDEEFAGTYGNDGVFRRAALKYAFGGSRCLDINVTYYPRSLVPDSGVQDDGRKETREAQKNKLALKYGARKILENIRPRSMSFAYTRVQEV